MSNPDIKDKNFLLNKPFKINKKVIIKNRILKSAMSEQLGDRLHRPGPGLALLYETWARGGTGLAITGNVMIDSNALGEPHNVVLENEKYLESFKDWAKAGIQNNAHLWVQLNHPGKQSPRNLTKTPVSASAVPLSGGLEKLFNTPRALSDKEICEIVEKFGRSALLSRQAGFTGVQIHGAHGYLVSQFLSPRHNIREDAWGGSQDKRRRFVLEVYRAIRKAVGNDFPVGIKLNSADFQRGGFTQKESMNVIQALAAEGIDLIEISGGTYESPAMTGEGKKIKNSTKQREAYFLEYAQKARELVDTPLAVTGGFRSLGVMEDALKSGATDFIGMARPLAVEPELPNKFFSGELLTIDASHPSTGSALLDKAAMLTITWYEHQLARIAHGKRPDMKMSAWGSMLSTMMSTGLSTFRKRRA